LPVTVLAFVIGGVALMGVVPSGAYLAKKLLLDSADASGQWWWTVVLQGGAAFTAGYVVLVLVRVLRRPAAPLVEVAPVSLLSQLAALGLALASLLLSLAAALGPLPSSLLSNPLSPKDLGTTLAVLLGGVLLAAALARRPLFGRDESAARRATVGLGLAFERGDYLVRGWPSAMLALLLVAAASGFLLVRA
jgi:NADH:ubiquinone oxidoreductase subunit 5 (subunit L)/multisubunit Na+/H+ antiporter MnhA subunit